TSTKGKVAAKVQDGLFAYLRSKGWDTTNELSISYVCFEGSKEPVDQQKAIVKKIVRNNGGITLGAGPGAIYDQKKLDTPYLRDSLTSAPVFGEVCDPGAPWSTSTAVPAMVSDASCAAQREQCLPGFMFWRMSHS